MASTDDGGGKLISLPALRVPGQRRRRDVDDNLAAIDQVLRGEDNVRAAIIGPTWLPDLRLWTLTARVPEAGSARSDNRR